jgi:hypothetical protein
VYYVNLYRLRNIMKTFGRVKSVGKMFSGCWPRVSDVIMNNMEQILRKNKENNTTMIKEFLLLRRAFNQTVEDNDAIVQLLGQIATFGSPIDFVTAIEVCYNWVSGDFQSSSYIKYPANSNYDDNTEPVQPMDCDIDDAMYDDRYSDIDNDDDDYVTEETSLIAKCDQYVDIAMLETAAELSPRQRSLLCNPLIDNPYDMRTKDRIELLVVWQKLLKADCSNNPTTMTEYIAALNEDAKYHARVNAEVLKVARLVGMTTTGAARQQATHCSLNGL